MSAPLLSHPNELAAYEVDPLRGFLPSTDPLATLPARFSAWDEIVSDFSTLVTRDFRAIMRALPLLDPAELASPAERERAFLVLSLAANVYVFGAGRAEVVPSLPPSIAIPFSRVAAAVGRPPIFSYPTAMHNWRLKDPSSGITFDNLECLHTFTTSPSEPQFWRALLAMEAVFAPGLLQLPALRRGMFDGDADVVASAIGEILHVCDELGRSLLELPAVCDVHGWLYALMPYMSGWNEFSSHGLLRDGLVYEGASPERQKYNSATAAQSAIFMLLDALLGIGHDRRSMPFLQYTFNSLHPGHRKLIGAVAEGPSLRQFVAEHATIGLIDRYCELTYMVAELRHRHLTVVDEFLQRRYLSPQQQAFMSKMISDTRAIVLPLAEQRQRLKRAQAKPQGAVVADETRWTIVYGSQFGSATVRANRVASVLTKHAPRGVSVRLVGMDDYDILTDLATESLLLVVTSTFGNGEPPVMGEAFRHALKRAVDEGLRSEFSFSVFGLGSSLFPHFCGFARDVDRWLGELGGNRVVPLMTKDAAGCQGDEFDLWRDSLVDHLLGRTPPVRTPLCPPAAELHTPEADCLVEAPSASVVAVLGNSEIEMASVARHLLRSGRYRVRIVVGKSGVVKNPAWHGCEVARVDADDPVELTAALRGARAVFAAFDTFELGENRELAQGAQIVDACCASGVEQFLWISERSSDVPFQRAKPRVAEYARDRHLLVTELLPSNPYVLFATTWAPRRTRDGSYVFFLPPGSAETKRCYYSPDDLGGWVVACMDSPKTHADRVVHLCSEYVDLEQVAALFSAATGDRCRVEPMTYEQVAQVHAFGPATGPLCELWKFQTSHHWRDCVASLEIYPKAVSLGAWMVQNKISLASRFRGPYT